jgi:hypothetical protein
MNGRLRMTEPLLALKTATVLFGLAAAGGVLMLLIRLRGAPRPPSLIAMVHGLVAASGLTLLIYFGATTSIPSLAKAATAVFLVAALGGLWLNVRFHSNMLPLPVAGILGHAAVAVTGFVLLVLAVLNNPG